MNKEKYDEMVLKLEEQAGRGDTTAMSILERLYLFEESPDTLEEEDFIHEETIETDWTKLEEAKMKLKYMEGINSDRMNRKAVAYQKESADAGNVYSQYTLALNYMNGSYVPKNERLAMKYFRMSAKTGYKEAQFSLGSHLFISLLPNTEWLHWICCSYIQDELRSKYFMDFLRKHGGDKAMEAVDHCIDFINKNGMETIYVPSSPEEEYFIAMKLKTPNKFTLWLRIKRNALVGRIKALFGSKGEK